ncbi:glycosyltransferase [Sinomicrobium sp. M5D2P17]
MKSITHITTVHPRYDTRIFLKECNSIKENYKIVNLIVADGLGNEVKNGVNIYDIGKPKNRLIRMLFYTKKAYMVAKKMSSSIYHIHDPELVFSGLKLKGAGERVIFDAHEDLPKQLKSKPYLNGFLRTTLSMLASITEKYTLKKYTMLVGATPSITSKLKKINSNAVNINNYPILGELDNNTKWSSKRNEVCYLGGITRIRGIVQLIKAMEYVEDDIKLNLVGGFSENGLIEELKQERGWEKVNYLGVLSRKEVSKILARSKGGIVTFLNVPNHIESQPNKMFEYMSSGIPVIGSNFPLWKEILEKHKCGLTVNPEDPKAIAEGIMQLIRNDDQSKEMGENGKKIVNIIYNWSAESKKLINAYKVILSQ